MSDFAQVAGMHSRNVGARRATDCPVAGDFSGPRVEPGPERLGAGVGRGDINRSGITLYQGELSQTLNCRHLVKVSVSFAGAKAI